MKHRSIWTTLPILALAATLVRPLWGAPADILSSGAPVPGDPAPKTRAQTVGDATVSTQNGALSYGFPLTVPRGRGGATPSLALTYSSRGAVYGGVAQGWSLSIPEISWDKSAGELGNRWVSALAGGKHLVPVTGPALPADALKGYRAQHDTSYARYFELDGTTPGLWRVETPDGMTYRFSEANNLENDGDVGAITAPPHWFPLTSTEDPFGNRVDYIWHVDPSPGYPNAEGGRRSIHLDRIEYSSNAGIEPHAMVKFNRGSATFPPGSGVPHGASQDVIDPDAAGNFDHEVWYRGARRIDSIDMKVKDAPGPDYRIVRRYELTYDDIACAGSCPEPQYGAYRSLLAIQEIGDPAGPAPLSLPAVTFGYGPGTADGTTRFPARAPIYPTTYDTGGLIQPHPKHGVVNWLAAGVRWPAGARSAEVEQMLADLDGDGRLDIVRSIESGGSCALEWYRNISGTPGATYAIEFEESPLTVALPTLPWEAGGAPTADESCSLTGQFFHRDIPPISPNCDEDDFGSYLFYRLMDLDGDGLQDLVTAVHVDRTYDPSADITSALYGGVAPSCPAEPSYCRAIDPVCLDGAKTCQGDDPPYCEYAEPALQGCWDTGTPTDCDVLESYLLPGGAPGEGGADPCSFYGRKAYSLDCGYLWTVYYNNGDAGAASPFFDLAQPDSLISPSELESYLGDGTLAVTNRGNGSTSWTNHGVMDFNGDGVLDVAHTMSDAEGIWALWLGTVQNGKLSFDTDNTVIWQAPKPMGDTVAPGNTNPDPTQPQYSVSVSRLGLVDVDGNGHLDLVSSGGIHWNKGNGFPLGSVGGLFPLEFQNLLGMSVTEETDGDLDGVIKGGDRFACIRSIDHDQDGRPDFVECRDNLNPVWDPRVGYGRGDRTGPVIEIPDLYVSQDDHHGHYQIVDSPGTGNGPTNWKLLSGFIDLDGDGLEEDINFQNTFSRINDELPGTPPIRSLISIDNGRGLTTNITYAPHVDETVVDPGEGRLPKATWVVKSIERVDAHGAGGTTEYTYRGPMFGADDDGKYGFRGFDEARTLSPLGALTVNRYDYELDWSGRLVETLVFAAEADYGGDESTSSTDEAVSISWTEWRHDSELCDTFGASIDNFLVKYTDSFTCENGQTIDDCKSTGAQQRSSFSYSKIPSALDPQVCRPGLEYHCSDSSCSPRDTRVDYTHDWVIDADRYRVRRDRKSINEYTQTMGLSLIARDYFTYEGAALEKVKYHYVVLGGGLPTARTDFTYDAFGNVLTKKLPGRSVAQQFTYSGDTFHLHPESITSELGHVVSQEIDLGTGNVLATNGPNEKGGVAERTETVYDAAGRPLTSRMSIDDGVGGYQIKDVSFVEYFDAESPQRVVTSARKDFNDGCTAAGNSACVNVTEKFDGHGRLISSTQNIGGFDVGPSHTYDAAGNVVVTTVPDPSDSCVPGPGGGGCGSPATVAYTTSYDTLGRPTAFSTPATTWPELVMEYDGLEVTRKTMLTDTAVAEQTRLESDVFGRLVKVEEALDSGGTSWATTQYGHDGLGNLVEVTSADGVVTDIERNRAGWRTSITRDGRTWQYRYNVAGDMTAIVAPVPASGNEIDYTTSIVYDDLGRPTSKLPGTRAMSQPELDELGIGMIVYTYDQGDNGVGRLTHVERGAVWTKDLTYNAQGGAISDTHTFTVPGAAGDVTDTRTQSFTYNAMGAVSSAIFPDDANPTLATNTWVLFDALGRPERLQSNHLGSAWVEVDYNLAGLAVKREVENIWPEIHREVSHDVLGRVVKDDVKLSNGEYRSRQRFTYAGGLNRIIRLDTEVGTLGWNPPPMPANTFTFTYDQQNQIAGATGPGSGANQYAGAFTYTPGGRLATATVSANPTAPLARTRDVIYDYGDGSASDPEALEKLDNAGGGTLASYAYDDAGNAVSRTEGSEVWSFVYGGEDQQRKVTAPDGSSEIYHYDESGGRILAIERNSAGVPQKIRWWFGATEIHYDGAGAETRTLVHDGLGAPQIRIRDRNIVEHTFHDGRGHLLVALDATGFNVKAGFTYGPFGEVLSAIGTPDDFVRRFNGKEFDQVSSLSYYGARYYDALALTWTQADPLYRFAPEFAFDEPRRANLYAFTLNNALSFSDPEGLDAEGEKPFTPPPCALTGDPGGCELAVGLAQYDAAWERSQMRGIRWGGESAKLSVSSYKSAEFQNDGYDPYGTRYPDGGDEGGGEGPLLTGALAVLTVVACLPPNTLGCVLGAAVGASTSGGGSDACSAAVGGGFGCVSGGAGCARGGAGCAGARQGALRFFEDLGGSGQRIGVISLLGGKPRGVRIAARQAGGLNHRDIANTFGNLMIGEGRLGMSYLKGGWRVSPSSAPHAPTRADVPGIAAALQKAGFKGAVEVGLASGKRVWLSL